MKCAIRTVALLLIALCCTNPAAASSSIQYKASVAEGHSRLPKPPLTHIAGFTVLEVLGEGDQARVYKANDVHGQPVALKVFYTKSEFVLVHPERQNILDLFFDEDGASRAAHSESLVGSKLSHPNIIKVDRQQEMLSPDDEKQTFLVLEYVQGKNLGQVSQASLSKKESLQIAVDLLSALRHGFSHGLIHNDLWSENIFIDSESKLKLIDVGSFDPLPEKYTDKKRTYKKYSKVLVNILGKILDRGNFTSKERAKYNKHIQVIINESNDCPLSISTQHVIEHNLEFLEKSLIDF